MIVVSCQFGQSVRTDAILHNLADECLVAAHLIDDDVVLLFQVQKP